MSEVPVNNKPLGGAHNDVRRDSETYEYDNVGPGERDCDKPTASGIEDGKMEINGDDKAHDSDLRTIRKLLQIMIPYGGMLSTGFNMASTSIGAGILGLPAAFHSVGIIMATVYLVLITAETIYSTRLLVQVSERTGLRSFEEMARQLLHPRADIVVAILRALHTIGCSVAYVVTIGDLLRPILASFDSTPAFLRETKGIRLLQSGFWLVFMLPLVFQRQINSLRYVSAVGILFILYFAVVVVVHSAMNGMSANPRPAVRLVNTGNTALEGLGVIIFSYMCQINCVEVALEMRPRSLRRLTLCAFFSMTICGLLYFVTGLFGYLDFGEVEGSILLKYNPLEQPQIFVSYIGVFIKICASFGLLNNACRSALFPLIGWDPYTVAYWKYLIGAVLLAVLDLMLGLFVPNVTMVLGFTGGVCGGSVGFILPALFIMYSGGWTLRSVGIVNYTCTYLVLFAGVVGVVFGTAATIYSAVGG
ncbi:putative amino acid transporter aATP11 [Leptomonas pyrrhocoris]|uniref:Putative amino acid transporter aATP11 n=1 Tax=Leptomonas pyrrhocoris TaxID=157538 RepID=A0A0N0DQZ8_LEPPY|nr:putative amino acid transporter aATP11 [Leptomonas pyrrhocoris]XP_015652350.1 putative amino acid transporter aATP11 [Leptomonas pyrrhocoris]XP_015652351.1 putative amino acid transporter aATP11 [Leptomonas pyrrhocoris]KPA73910.1 putative amino acid transporter aATP11 [Leptomonas pyrrhocoris]KPA73911.1 putative amino acid transporter aATP11 [Leptomonas pyrrhocoris]KPA73912.1 putative amino acid transporter aATP11 [Leptomonas pyrrhocoris]|eukprot:XP_015652349.1 putative amino acid transporter aATP11 [Leptomonas pyrrhocoris]